MKKMSRKTNIAVGSILGAVGTAVCTVITIFNPAVGAVTSAISGAFGTFISQIMDAFTED